MPSHTNTSLPAQNSKLQHNYATDLADLCSKVAPFPVSEPQLVLKNMKLAKDLGLAHLFADKTTLIQALFCDAGELNQHSVAQKYGGHQFGQWNPNLGDGRGLLLGEVYNQNNGLIDLHLKGAGPTPYSRHADGRAVLRSTIREYLGAEALHHLGIPSSRSLALITSHEPVIREQRERGAMLIRTCPSHIRFGHFEYFFHTNEPKKLDQLFEFCFDYHFPHCKSHANPHLALLTEICQSTALLVAKWQAYGFNHGVMNTDNMSIHGITFDYGPYAFLDDFIPQYICNKSDHGGRYAFNQQPSIALWNVNALAHSFSNKASMQELKQALSLFEPTFTDAYKQQMLAKFGVSKMASSNANKQAFSVLANQFVKLLAAEYADYHHSFRRLSMNVDRILQGDYVSFSKPFKQQNSFQAWSKRYHELLNKHEVNANALQLDMLATNPKYVLRNHLMQQAIAKATEDDFEMVNTLMQLVTHPFDEHPQYHELALPPSDKEKGIALSCSS